MGIPLEALAAVRRIIVHANCPDGRASALILHAALPTAEICEMSYGEPAHEQLEPAPGLLFCDFTPPKARLQAFAAAGAIVLDHHEARLVEPFGALGVFGENAEAESGAALALREVLGPLRGPEPGFVPDGRWKLAERMARLAAIRDTWQRSSLDWDAAGELAGVLRFIPLVDALDMGIGRVMRLAEDLGPLLLRKQRAAADVAAANAVRYTIRPGLRVAVVATLQTSDVADLLGDEVDVVAGFEYVHEAGGGRVRLKISLRSRGGIDVQRVAKHFGGGGHKAAAGFSCEVTTDPFAHPATLTHAYERIHATLRDRLLVPLEAPRAG